jgi:methylated-DNA-[protein]-cysteine S-methyltransferase
VHTRTPETGRNASRVIYYSEAASPIGPLLLTSDGKSLTGVYMSEHKHGPVAGEALSAWGIVATSGDGRIWVQNDEARPFQEAKEQLAAYFEGTLTEFDLPLLMEGTDFQRRVWEALQEIPYGTTISYGQLARRVDNPKGSRAVGLANGRNPISIIVPCHRVIGSNGKLTGYGGGLPRKAALLDFEFSVMSTGTGSFQRFTNI